MKSWNEIRPIVKEILEQQHYTNSGNYNGTRAFLSAYQIAVLVNKRDTELKGEDLHIGGKGRGGEDNSSFAQKIAWFLSRDINDNVFNGQLEIQFFSTKGLDPSGFTFDNGKEPSSEVISMFRLV